MEIPVSFEEQFRDTESSSLTVVLLTWMEGVVTGSVDKQWREPGESHLLSEISASSQGPQNDMALWKIACLGSRNNL